MKVRELLLAALTRREALAAEDLERHWGYVLDNDHCLAAVRELLQRHLLESAAAAGSIHSSDSVKLRCCERLECFRMMLLEIEAALDAAKTERAK